jgi:ABC-type polysaccharide/polyol phosphate transport system ATPase subunit
MEKVEINVDNVTMKFRLSNEKVDSLKEYLLRIVKKNMGYSEFHALQNVSFKIYNGERVGIIGHNGAGKSTLLKIISGVMKPTSGKVSINGTIAPLLELGAGFDPELSGAENIYLNGAILGKTKRFLDSKYEEILEFSDLGDFIYTPVKNYSSGMKARLGFAIASQIGAQVLIVDEVLGVGDATFKKKSSKKMKELIEEGNTVLLVSHNLKKIEAFADRVIWLDKGKIMDIGEPSQICREYQEYLSISHK